MKTSIKTFFTVYAIVISLSLSAQPHNGGNYQNHQNNQNNNNHNQNYGGQKGHVTIQIGGGYPNTYYGNNYGYGNHYYGNYGYQNYNSIQNIARNSIRQSAGFIGQALQFTTWNDIYSPWLAKAIRHQQYAKQLYFWGDYAGAMNHSERAGFLAWNALSNFNNGYGYNAPSQNNYTNPYSDPNNPYYRQGNSGNQQNTTIENTDDYSYRKAQGNTDAGTTDATKTTASKSADRTELDGALPQNKMTDKELVKINAKDLDIE
jgi:hypothetical protein